MAMNWQKVTQVLDNTTSMSPCDISTYFPSFSFLIEYVFAKLKDEKIRVSIDVSSKSFFIIYFPIQCSQTSTPYLVSVETGKLTNFVFSN